MKAMAFWIPCLLATYMAFTPKLHSEMPQINDKIQHLLAFGYLTVTLRWAYFSWATPVRTFCLLFAYGLLIELIQGFIPRRQSSGLDLMVDVIGILMALVGFHLLTRWWNGKTSNAVGREKTTAAR
jgi:VanZ family protein